MNLPIKLSFISDENIPVTLTELLRKDGFDVIKAPLGFSDKQVSKMAREESRVILTLDKHFIDKLKLPPKELEGIIFLDIQPPIIDMVYSSLQKFFREVSIPEVKGNVFILSRASWRRKP